MRATFGPARRFGPSRDDVDRLRRYGASTSYIEAVTRSGIDQQSASVRDAQRSASRTRNDPFRRTRWRRAISVSCAVSALPGVLLVLMLPDLVERNSPLVWCAALLGLPLTFTAMLLIVYCVGWAVFNIILAEEIDRTYAMIEVIAVFMPLRISDRYVSTTALSARAVENAQTRDTHVAAVPKTQSGFRRELRAEAPSVILHAWRERLTGRSSSAGGADLSTVAEVIVRASVTLVALAVLGIVSVAGTAYLRSIDERAGLVEILALQAGGVGVLLILTSILFLGSSVPRPAS